MTAGQAIRRFLIWALWLGCVYAWGSDIVFRALGGQYRDLIVFVLLIPLFLLIYLSEGIEIAVADLNDKDAAQLGDASMRTLLTDIKSRIDFFIAQQQTLALCVVTLSSIIVSLGFNTLWIYPFGEVDNPLAIGAINFIAISISILCLCQVPAKRLALSNSERFLAQAQQLWKLIRVVGVLDLPAPSENITDGMRRLFRFPPRRLPPSRASHYNASALIHGYCLDQLAVKIRLHENGGAEISRHHLVAFLHGSRKILTGRMRVGNDCRFVNRLELMECWKLPSVEDLRSYESLFDEVFAASQEERLVEPILQRHHCEITDLQQRVRYEFAPNESPVTYDWRVHFLDGLPEDWSPNAPTEYIICLLYRISGTAPANSFA